MNSAVTIRNIATYRRIVDRNTGNANSNRILYLSVCVHSCYCNITTWNPSIPKITDNKCYSSITTVTVTFCELVVVVLPLTVTFKSPP